LNVEASGGIRAQQIKRVSSVFLIWSRRLPQPGEGTQATDFSFQSRQCSPSRGCYLSGLANYCVLCSLVQIDYDVFLQGFETGTLPNAAFHHVDHLRLSWLYLRRDGLQSARSISSTVFAAIHGAADRFHLTQTRFWIRLVQHLMEAFPTIERFEDLLDAFPPVMDKAIVYRHYSPTHLTSPIARHVCVAPDLLPLP